MARDGRTHIFRGKTYVEAVAKAKTKLGKDISIVNRRDIRESNLFSRLTSGKLGGDSLSVELEVAVTPPEPQVSQPAAVNPNPLLRTYAKAQEGIEKYNSAAKDAMTKAAKPHASIGEAATGIANRLDAIQKAMEQSNRDTADMREEFRLLVSLQARGGVPAVSPELLVHYRRLVGSDIEEELARNVVETVMRERAGLDPDAGLLPALRCEISRRVPVAGPVLPVAGKPTVVAVVGPSGVGKSTCVVKLAIRFGMDRPNSVGVINEDISRPGADSQLTNLGRLFGISVTTASEPREVRDVVRSMAGRDIVLLDTGGRSPRDARGIERLAEIVKAAGADEVHLVLSSVSSEKTMLETVSRFNATGFNRIIMTKLDECVSFGPVVNVAARFSQGISYFTTGPDYGTPVEMADGDKLAGLVLGETEITVDHEPGVLNRDESALADSPGGLAI